MQKFNFISVSIKAITLKLTNEPLRLLRGSFVNRFFTFLHAEEWPVNQRFFHSGYKKTAL